MFSDIELRELLCILEVNRLSIASFAVIFSHSEGCLFIVYGFLWAGGLLTAGPPGKSLSAIFREVAKCRFYPERQKHFM